jgi:hypothetical protein
MSQHISGNVGNTVSHDYGDFVQVGRVRVRKDMVTCYFEVLPELINDRKEGWSYFYINYNVGSHNFGCGPDEESASELVARLDWIFKKDTLKDKLNE